MSHPGPSSKEWCISGKMSSNQHYSDRQQLLERENLSSDQLPSEHGHEEQLRGKALRAPPDRKMRPQIASLKDRATASHEHGSHFKSAHRQNRSDKDNKSIRTSPENHPTRTFDPLFKKQDRKFFSVGRVFKTVWAEPAGNISYSKRGKRGQIIKGNWDKDVYHSVKLWVVIREGENYCQTLKIESHGDHGCSGTGVIKSENSVVYSGKEPPMPHPDELGKDGEAGLLPIPIRVVLDNHRDPDAQLWQTSRLNFGKTYTVEHYNEVRTIGQVHPHSMDALRKQLADIQGYAYENMPGSEDNIEAISQEVLLSAAKQISPISQENFWPVHKYIWGRSEKGEINDEYHHIQSNPLDFFVSGRVFTIIEWNESSPGDEGYEGTVITDEIVGCEGTDITDEIAGLKTKDQLSVSNRRWFVVIQRLDKKCLCLPIISYEGRGVPEGYIKAHHAIVYTGKIRPQPMEWELTRNDADALRNSLRVRRDDFARKLKPLSRIRYSTLYEVAFDVRARSFGMLSRRYNWIPRDTLKILFPNSTPNLSQTSGPHDDSSEHNSSSPGSADCEVLEKVDLKQGQLYDVDLDEQSAIVDSPSPRFVKNQLVLIRVISKHISEGKYEEFQVYDAKPDSSTGTWKYALKDPVYDDLFQGGLYIKEENIMNCDVLAISI